MNLGVNLSMIFTEVPLIERFALAKQAGFDTIEIQFPYELSIAQIQHQLVQHQLKLCLINVPADTLLSGGDGLACVPHRKEDFAYALTQAIDYAQALNIPKINVLSGRVAQAYTSQQAMQCFIENLAFSVSQCHDKNIQVVFEMINQIDMPNFLIHDFNQVNEVLSLVPHALLQFDCYHVAKIQQPIIQNLQQYWANIGHIQFADYPQRQQPDTGELNFTEIFNYLKNHHYQGDICAEYRPSANSLDSFDWKTKYFNH